MTSLGASIVVPEAVETVSRILTEFVEIGDLHRKASAVIAAACGAEAGTVTASASAGITVSVAGCLTGADLARIERLPDTSGLERDEVVIQTGHMVYYGAPVEQAIRLAGAKVVPVGTATYARPYHLEGCDRPAHGGRGLRRLAPCGRLRPDRARRVLPGLPRARRAGHRRRGLRVRPQGLPRRRRRPRRSTAPTSSWAAPPPGIVAGRKDLVRAAYPAELRHRPRHEGRQGEHRRRHGGAGGLGAARPRRRPRLRARSSRALAGVPGPPAGARGRDRPRPHRQPARSAGGPGRPGRGRHHRLGLGGGPGRRRPAGDRPRPRGRARPLLPRPLQPPSRRGGAGGRGRGADGGGDPRPTVADLEELRHRAQQRLLAWPD